MKSSYQDIRSALFDARNSCDLWWLLIGAHDQRTKVINGFENLPVTYATLCPALYTSFIIKLCSVFGTGSHDLTLKSLPNAELDSEFARVWEIGRRLYKLRSKVVAHLDKRCDPDQIAKDTGLTYDGLRQFLADTVSLFDRIAATNGERDVNDFGLGDEFPTLLTLLGTTTKETEVMDANLPYAPQPPDNATH